MPDTNLVTGGADSPSAWWPQDEAHLSMEPAAHDPFASLAPIEIERAAPARVAAWSADTRADRFEAWSRELSGEQLAAAVHALVDSGHAQELASAVQQLSPPLVQAEYTVQLRRLVTRQDRVQAQDHLQQTARELGVPVGSDEAHAAAFRSRPDVMAVPALNEHALAFDRMPRIVNTRPELVELVARGFGWDAQSKSDSRMQVLRDGRVVTPRLQELFEAEAKGLPLAPGGGLDPVRQERVFAVAAAIRDVSSGGTASVLVLPVLHPLEGGEAGVVKEPLFKVVGRDKQTRYVDAQGARYDTISDYLAAPTRPRGVPIVMPRGHYDVDERGSVLPWVTKASPSVLRSHTLQKVAGGVTAVGTVATYSGAGAWAGVPTAIGGAYLLASHGDRLGWTAVHAPERLDPIEHPQALVDMGSFALGVTGLGQVGAKVVGHGLSTAADRLLMTGNRVMAGVGALQAAPSMAHGDVLAGADAVANAAVAVLGQRTLRRPNPPAAQALEPVARPSVAKPDADRLAVEEGHDDANPPVVDALDVQASPSSEAAAKSRPPPTGPERPSRGATAEMTASQRALYTLPSFVRTQIKRAKELTDQLYGRSAPPARPAGFDALVGEPPAVLQQRVIRVGDQAPLAQTPEPWIDPPTPGVKEVHSAVVEAPTIRFNGRDMRVGYNFEDRSAEVRTDGKGHYWLGDPADPHSALVSGTLDGNIIRNVIYRRELAGPGSTDDFSLACSLLKRLQDDGMNVVGIEVPESLRKNKELQGNLGMSRVETGDGQTRYHLNQREPLVFKPHGESTEEGVAFSTQFSNELVDPGRAQSVDLRQGRYRLVYVVTDQGELRYSLDRGGPMFMFSGILNPNFIRHSDLAAGGRVFAAGEAIIENGKLVQLDNNSGHYLPYGDSAAYWALKAFGELVDVSEARYIEHIGFGRSDTTLPARRYYDMREDRWLPGAPPRPTDKK